MFGFLPGPKACCAKAAACYRAHFCGLCNTMRKDYGLWARGLINRDSTFLAVLGGAQQVKPLAASSATCCNPWAAPRDLFQDGTAMQYAAAVTLCGLGTKLEDDRADERGPRRWLAALGARACDGPVSRAVGLLHSLDFPVGKVMRAMREDALQARCGLTLEEAAQPTALSYGEIVAHTGVLANVGDAALTALRDIGERLGFLIYAKDAWEDWEQDWQRGRFNPLHHLEHREDRLAAVLPLVTRALASLRSSFERLPLHRNRDLLSSMLVDGSETSMQKALHIQGSGDGDEKKKSKRRKKEGCCERCDCGGGCDCTDCCCRCVSRPGRSGGNGPGHCGPCDCNPCDGDGCECGGCDCGCDCS